MTQTQSLRDYLVQQLGGKCDRCGWNEDPRVLQITTPTDDQDSREQRKRNRERYYMTVLSEITSGKYGLICANCKAIRMLELAVPKQERAAVKDIFLWLAEVPAEIALARYDWLDRELEKGLDVHVLTPDGRVYRYAEEEIYCVAESWEEFARQHGVEEKRPEGPTAVLKRGLVTA